MLNYEIILIRVTGPDNRSQGKSPSVNGLTQSDSSLAFTLTSCIEQVFIEKAISCKRKKFSGNICRRNVNQELTNNSPSNIFPIYA